eukprot:scaffold48164_cov68-Phaeocystis_antarctica.AAC.3
MPAHGQAFQYRCPPLYRSEEVYHGGWRLQGCRVAHYANALAAECPGFEQFRGHELWRLTTFWSARRRASSARARCRAGGVPRGARRARPSRGGARDHGAGSSTATGDDCAPGGRGVRRRGRP